MTELEEAGEEDMCSLLNQVMGARTDFGSGADLSEFLEALAELEKRAELHVREYRIEKAQYVYLGAAHGTESRPVTVFNFDPKERIWKWRGTIRQMVEVPDE